MQLFSPKTPSIPEPPKAPTVDSAAQAEADIMRLRKRRGLASTFLTQPGVKASPAASALMGTGTGTSLGAGIVPRKQGM